MNPSSHFNQEEDWFWIEKIREGDASAFRRIFEKYKIKIFHLAFRFVREKTLAEDIAQEVFIKVYEKKVKVDSQSTFSTWLYRVTVNAAFDALRKRKHLPDSLDRPMPGPAGEGSSLLEKIHPPNEATPNAIMIKNEIAGLVQREVDRLPEKLRLPIVLYQFQEMSYREIAAILGVTEKAIEKRLRHAKDILKKKLRDSL